MEENDNDCILEALINFLTTDTKKYRDEKIYKQISIPEIKLLNEFPTYSVIFPVGNFSPRIIIEHMKNRHEYIKYMIEEELVPLEYYLYRYKHDERIDCYKFTNNMSLFHDIITICYLYLLTVVIDLKDNELKLIKDLSQIMTNKYQIQLNKLMLTHQNAITVATITFSFPSISYPVYYFLMSKHDYKYETLFISSNVPSTKFVSFYVIRYFWLCIMFSLIIPKLDRDTYFPLGYLIGLCVKADVYLSLSNPNYIRRSLKEMYEDITRLYYTEIFPISLKLTICEFGNIVQVKNNSYEYTPFFKTCRNDAIRIISMLYSSDPNLQSILSKL